jgi:hypothetical protein
MFANLAGSLPLISVASFLEAPQGSNAVISDGP